MVVNAACSNPHASSTIRTTRLARGGPVSINEVQILPDPGQHELLVATLERVNRVSNAARAAALARPGGNGGAELRDIVTDEIERAKLPAGFHAPIVDRVQAALDRRLKKFSTYQ